MSLAAFGPCDKKKDQSETDTPNMFVINVLDKEFHDKCHIQSSINVPLENIEKYAQKNINKNDVIVVYCGNYMCTASGESARSLQKLGFKQVYAYEGGTAEWAHYYPDKVVGECTAGYLKKWEKPKGHEEAEDIKIISTDDLLKMMKEFKLL